MGALGNGRGMEAYLSISPSKRTLGFDMVLDIISTGMQGDGYIHETYTNWKRIQSGLSYKPYEGSRQKS